MSDLGSILTGQYSHGMKKFLFDILKEKYAKHEDTIERITKNIVTASDYENAAKLFVDIYEKAFITAVEQHKSILEKNGIKAVISSSQNEKNGPKIFNQKNQVDN